MTKHKHTVEKPSTGPRQALIERVNYLGDLISHLPPSILEMTFSSPGVLHFSLDPDTLEDGGVFAAGSQALEVAFKLHQNNGEIKFGQRGAPAQSIVPFLKDIFKKLSPIEREAFEDAWLKRLVTAAKNAGAKIPGKSAPATKLPQTTSAVPPTHSLTPPVIEAAGTDSEGEQFPPQKRRHTATHVNSDTEVDSDIEITFPPAQSSSRALATLAVHAQTRADTAIPNTQAVDLKQNTQGTLEVFGWKKGWDSTGAKEHFLAKTSSQWRAKREEILVEER
ncbi:hypothetical protein GGX14DRAFT_574007 [Mycena pura]|uniref:Uncharacterized protein n=1 Tax=Mycena pura TaxID=153505 RepID=A0AAD6Y5E6_9AGAR|nr:hypothetical protein GGX14DRAFT_574007 [Mycena pura]